MDFFSGRTRDQEEKTKIRKNERWRVREMLDHSRWVTLYAATVPVDYRRLRAKSVIRSKRQHTDNLPGLLKDTNTIS